MLHMYRYIDSLRIKYHLLSVVILVKMFANVFSYNPITSSWKEFSKTSIHTATADEFGSSVMHTRPNVTFAAIRSGIVYPFLFVVVIAYILVFSRPLSVNSAKAFLIISTINEATVLAFLVLGKRKFKSQFRETFIEEKPYTYSGYKTLCIFMHNLWCSCFRNIWWNSRANESMGIFFGFYCLSIKFFRYP